MTSPPNTETLAALAAQVADLRGQVTVISQRLADAGLTGDLDLAVKFEQLAQTVADALDAAAPKGPAPVFWLGLDPDGQAAELVKLRKWADLVLRSEYGLRELRDCWPRHKRAVYELSVLAAEWNRVYGGKRPDRDRALDFYDRWLPNTLRRVTEMTNRCDQECILTPRSKRT